LNDREVVDIAGQILSGLYHVHSKGVIHRDLHVDNVLFITEKKGTVEQELITVKITDFGISKLIKTNSPSPGMLRDTGLIAYTRIGRDYDVAPELIAKGYTTHQSDIYQLGLMLYYLYTGNQALNKEDGPPAQAIITGIARFRAESLGNPLGACIAKMLRRNEEWRFKNTVEVWEELQQTVAQKPVLGSPNYITHSPQQVHNSNNVPNYIVLPDMSSADGKKD